MAGIENSWQFGSGDPMQGIETPDTYKVFVKYAGGWNPGMSYEEAGNSHRLGDPDMPNGEYVFDPRGVKDGVYSKYDANKLVTYVHSTGSAAVTPTYGSTPDGGDESVAGPENFTATEAP